MPDVCGPVCPPQINVPLTLMGDQLSLINGSQPPINVNGRLICGGKTSPKSKVIWFNSYFFRLTHNGSLALPEPLNDDDDDTWVYDAIMSMAIAGVTQFIR